MTFASAVRAATEKARKTGRFWFVCKDRCDPDDQWEVCSETDADTRYQGSSDVREVSDTGLVSEDA